MPMSLYATLNGLPSSCARSAHSVAAIGSRFTSILPQLTEWLPASHLLFQSMASPNLEARLVPTKLSRPITRRPKRTTTTQIAIDVHFFLIFVAEAVSPGEFPNDYAAGQAKRESQRLQSGDYT